MRSLECYFDIYFPRCFTTLEVNTKITLLWARKQFAIQGHILYYIFPLLHSLAWIHQYLWYIKHFVWNCWYIQKYLTGLESVWELILSNCVSASSINISCFLYGSFWCSQKSFVKPSFLISKNFHSDRLPLPKSLTEFWNFSNIFEPFHHEGFMSSLLQSYKNPCCPCVKNNWPNRWWFWACHNWAVMSDVKNYDLIGSSKSTLEQRQFSRDFSYELLDPVWNR